ncbi:MAG: hypothetical protein RJA70_457 [Pseudomonadota bacterium]|jgi:hypothetical protein
MKIEFAKSFAAAAAAGLMAVACGGSTAPAETPDGAAAEAAAEGAEAAPAAEEAEAAPAAEGAAEDKACCKGMNECKGKGGCKVEGGNTCQGMNECKGKGGCNHHCPKAE